MKCGRNHGQDQYPGKAHWKDYREAVYILLVSKHTKPSRDPIKQFHAYAESYEKHWASLDLNIIICSKCLIDLTAFPWHGNTDGINIVYPLIHVGYKHCRVTRRNSSFKPFLLDREFLSSKGTLPVNRRMGSVQAAFYTK